MKVTSWWQNFCRLVQQDPFFRHSLQSRRRPRWRNQPRDVSIDVTAIVTHFNCQLGDWSSYCHLQQRISLFFQCCLFPPKEIVQVSFSRIKKIIDQVIRSTLKVDLSAVPPTRDTMCSDSVTVTVSVTVQQIAVVAISDYKQILYCFQKAHLTRDWKKKSNNGVIRFRSFRSQMIWNFSSLYFF